MTQRKIVSVVGLNGSGKTELYDAIHKLVHDMPENNGAPKITLISIGTLIERRIAHDEAFRMKYAETFSAKLPLPDKTILELLNSHEAFQNPESGSLILIGFPMNIDQFRWLQRHCTPADRVYVGLLNVLQSTLFARMKKQITDLTSLHFEKMKNSVAGKLSAVMAAATKDGFIPIQINADMLMSGTAFDVLANAGIGPGMLRPAQLPVQPPAQNQKAKPNRKHNHTHSTNHRVATAA